jgi:hypothetical protein
MAMGTTGLIGGPKPSAGGAIHELGHRLSVASRLQFMCQRHPMLMRWKAVLGKNNNPTTEVLGHQKSGGRP